MAVSQPPGLGFGGSWSSFGGASEEVPTPPTTPSLPPPPPGAAPPSLESLRRQLDSPAPAPSVVGPPSRQRSYGTLGERLGEGLRPPIGWNSSVASDAVFEPPERPSTAPVDDRARARDQQNVALLISSMQELTAVVATHSEEIRRLREDCRAFARRDAINEALSDVALRARSEGDHNRAALERVERRLAQLEGGLNGRVEGLKDPLVAAAERLSTRDARYPPPPNGHYDARGPRGTPNGHSAPPNGHYERPRGTPNGHSPSNGHYPPPEGRGPYPPPNNGEAPPRFLTPADVPNGHGAPPNGHYDARGPRAPPPNGFRGV